MGVMYRTCGCAIDLCSVIDFSVFLISVTNDVQFWSSCTVKVAVNFVLTVF